MRSPGRPRSAEAHRAILDATVGLLTEVGYQSLSIESVAARARVGKATVYRWWPSKVELVVEAVHSQALEIVPEPDTGSLHGDTRELIAGVVTLACSPLGRVIEALWAEAERSQALHETLETVFLARRQQIATRVLERALQRGEARRDVDIELISDLVLATVLHRARLDPGSLDALFVDRLTELLVAGIGVKRFPAREPGPCSAGRYEAL